MKSSFKRPLILFAALVLVVGTVGCQSGFKMRNPFSKAPKAESANLPSELDELDDLTPPPENYTMSDSEDRVKESDSIVQRGKYEAEETPSQVEPKVETSFAANPVHSEPTSIEEDASQTTFAANDPLMSAASANAPMQTNAAPMNVEPQTYATFDGARTSATAQPAADPYMDPYAGSNATVAANAFPAPQTNSPIAQTSATQSADFPIAQASATQSAAFPTARSFAPGSSAQIMSEQSSDFPVVSHPFPASDFNAAPDNRVESVAMSYDPTPSPAGNMAAPPSYPADSDPYSGVIYEPQTTSTGSFAPGSTALY